VTSLRYYLDEDHSDEIAALARQYGSDITSAHELGRRGLTDDVQLEYAARESRAIVTRNYDDFHRLTLQFQRLGRPHAGVVFVPPSLQSDNYSGIARALVAFAERYPDGRPAYCVDYLAPVPDA
jgi:hypothetical protein